MLLVIFVLLLALLAASPYIVVVYKRVKMLRHLKKSAEQSGFRMHALHNFVCLSRNTAPHYDLLFLGNGQAYAVKLWSAVKPNATLLVGGDGRVAYRVGVPAELQSGVNDSERTLMGRARRVPKTKNSFKLKKETQIIPIMLFYPTCARVLLLSHGTKTKLSVGDTLFGKTLCTVGYFEKMLLNSPKNDNTPDMVEK